MVLTLTAWAAITISLKKVIPTTSDLERGIAVPRFVYLIALWQLDAHQKVMKKIVFSLVFIGMSLFTKAQNDVTQFLGIHVDGNKSEMIQKLKNKGFRLNYSADMLEGKFNGTDVTVNIVTNRDKVCRIVINDAIPVDERSIQIRFNNLCRQFENNQKYLSMGNQTIPDNEDISYQMIVNNKRYEAVFYQQADTTLMKEKLMPIFLSKYRAEEIAQPTEKIKEDLLNITFESLNDICSKKPVWFMISSAYGKYFITMFYDNEYNRANGEDL